MITAMQAFEIAHQAIQGKRYHEAPCDIAIEREGGRYAVTFSSPKGAGTADPGPKPTRVVVDAESGAVKEIRDAERPERAPQFKGYISGKSALEVGMAKIRELAVPFDERWTTTVVLQGDNYHVTFPLPEQKRAVPRRADFALQVWVDARKGSVAKIRNAS